MNDETEREKEFIFFINSEMKESILEFKNNDILKQTSKMPTPKEIISYTIDKIYDDPISSEFVREIFSESKENKAEKEESFNYLENKLNKQAEKIPNMEIFFEKTQKMIENYMLENVDRLHKKEDAVISYSGNFEKWKNDSEKVLKYINGTKNILKLINQQNFEDVVKETLERNMQCNIIFGKEMFKIKKGTLEFVPNKEIKLSMGDLKERMEDIKDNLLQNKFPIKIKINNSMLVLENGELKRNSDFLKTR